jgi:AP-4 complex subunit epsilon-1
VIILKQVIEHKLPKEFDYHRMPAPWIQMKLLKILELLGKGDAKTSEHCYTIVEQALKRADETSNNISFAIAYQCIKTIFTIYPNEKLVSQAAAGLSKFLSSTSNNNLKHMGLRLLIQAHKDHPKLLEDYQLIIVECLESKDETLKQETLDLLYRMTTNENIEVIVGKMMETLHGATDQYFRNALVLKITELC